MEEEQDNLETAEPTKTPKKSVFSGRNLLVLLGLSTFSLVVVSLFTFALYRFGVFDNYIKNQFVAKMSEIGVEFKADKFRVAASPLELVLSEATFNDKTTGEKLFYIRDARLGLTVLDLLSWRLSRDISINSSEVNGAEVWVKFDENGRSNFSNLRLVEDEKGSAVNFKYESVNVAIRDTVIHFGDQSRKISGDAKNLRAKCRHRIEAECFVTGRPGQHVGVIALGIERVGVHRSEPQCGYDASRGDRSTRVPGHRRVVVEHRAESSIGEVEFLECAEVTRAQGTGLDTGEIDPSGAKRLERGRDHAAIPLTKLWKPSRSSAASAMRNAASLRSSRPVAIEIRR